MNENAVIFRLNLIIALLIANIVLLLVFFLPPELLFLGGILPAFLIPVALLLLLRLR
ncbi:uncharacterized protein Nmag_1557 [Natrialba magadii ATCC 43099]|uniref:Uncharacterized protein n=1 Tax=Natrialba magadii (strain ATCC 43099 / DSM 3394 / CCM 3739 / CIP 104546 / IAM 13178 / JCM 8861 / NBRC 102185 / NCIMB 2190 / MS3) TaxID=547559 RepID=D3SU75_NATMM|nr:hypothetical protein [Natrialba magadii]ADD05133.1 uncharacterized protein Nmag_1557 [Natrialba magadii ATCC 43099]ELY23171.1 hypothetical protein C500_20316 [Natrialba magadii ATCC 43099]